MIDVGKRVKILDNYSGGLDNVIGKSGKIVYTQNGFHVLDIEGRRKATWGEYWYDYPVLALEDELEVLKFNLTDGHGENIELGDTIVYGPLGGGITLGKVVDIAPYEGRVKFRLEIDINSSYRDGDSRKVSLSGKTYRWYHSGSRALVIKKAGS